MSHARGSVWTDKRLWVAGAVALLVGAGIGVVVDRDPLPPEPIDNPALAPTRPAAPTTGPMADVERVLREQQIRTINLNDGSSAEPPMGPEAAAAWIGGLLVFLGGFGAVWLWRRAEDGPDDLDRDEQFPTS